MKYVSTRGEAAVRGFSDILLTGLAEDGGLFMPESWPHFKLRDWEDCRRLSYPELAAFILSLFVGDEISPTDLTRLCYKAYSRFDHKAIVPITQLDHGLYVQELFHGPTLAFKDMAMQLLGQLFSFVLERRGESITIVGATSGDTGSAAIEALRGLKHVNVVILHPHGRTSEVQRRQMTTVHEDNIVNIAIDGTFDDCQDMVKALFADQTFRNEMHLSAVNSINWARIAAQIPYYIYSALWLGAPAHPVSFAVPTGNFGNILAAWAAKEIGLPVKTLCIGSNHNDILTRFILRNDMSVREVTPSLSPSMDIQVSSNFERLLFELLDRDAAQCRQIMTDFRATGKMDIPDHVWKKAASIFHALALSDEKTAHAISKTFKESHYLADPHTIIGIEAGKRHLNAGIPMIAMATANPAKFPDTIEKACGIYPPLPPHLSDLLDREERYLHLPNRLDQIQTTIRNAVLKNKS